jgi:DNA-binding NarL/FixJ family response regulator
MGFIPKSYSGKNLLCALRTVLDGDVYIPDTINRQLQHIGSGPYEKLQHYQAVSDTGITRRQLEVLRLLADGQSNKQISNQLFLTENTVKAHVSALFRSLGASNRTECVNIARHKGIIP